MKREENQTVEYKESWHEKYLEWICGYAKSPRVTTFALHCRIFSMDSQTNSSSQQSTTRHTECRRMRRHHSRPTMIPHQLPHQLTKSRKGFCKLSRTWSLARLNF